MEAMMPLVIEMNGKEVGSLFWELPAHSSEAYSKLPEMFQSAVKADLEDAVEACINLILANLHSKKLVETGFQPLQEVLLLATEDLHRKLNE